MAATQNVGLHFRVSPQVLGPLGIEQLHDPALAILELIKNSWDADATRVVVDVDHHGHSGKIAVVDNGHGMTQQEFEDRWLVIGSPHKRANQTSEGGRPLIGEKGLGRLASFALGRSLRIESSRSGTRAFRADVDWEKLRSAASLEEYSIQIATITRQRGTRVEIQNLTRNWTSDHTEFLATHAEFLASVPGERFGISLRVNGKRYSVESPVSTVARLSEAQMTVRISKDGTPHVGECTVNGKDQTNIVFRQMPPAQKDPRLADIRLSLQFFRRDEAIKQLSNVLERNEITEVLERYQGVRVYRDGINVPPYGLNRDDWAGLEKQRTATGGPTLVPGNSQLLGEIHITKRAQPHLVVTAGRSGFSDQSAVMSLANYVRWAVRELGTARRAEHLGITSRDQSVPARIDSTKSSEAESPESIARSALADISRAARADPALRDKAAEVTRAVTTALDRNEQTLRLYAQLASTGIAATSFAHELRAEFDVVSEAVDELARGKQKPDKQFIGLLRGAWNRIRVFAALFKILPVRLRRQRKTLSPADIKESVKTVLGLAPPDKVSSDVVLPKSGLTIVPAELDSILLNLVSNSVKAIAESTSRESGRIRIAFVIRGENLDIRIADNGCGISPKVAQVMFEPLEGRFAEGTGMGLSIVKFIAERYKGHVAVSPPPTGYKTEIQVHLRSVAQ